MTRRSAVWIRVSVALVLLVVASSVLHGQLIGLDPSEVLGTILELPTWRIAAAFGLTVLNYWQLTLYDVLGMRYIGRRLAYRKIALASFIATAFAHNIGPSLASGGSVRFRFYSAWGLRSGEVAVFLGFLALTFFVGFSWIGGVVLATSAAHGDIEPPVPALLLKVIGVALLVLGAAYLAVSWAGRPTIRVGSRSYPTPNPRLAASQIAVATLDWLAMSAILWLLLADGAIDYWTLLRIFVVAQIIGMLSQVPGGLGVFESLMVTSLSPDLPVPRILGTLVLYRCVYLLLPFAAALATLIVSEAFRLAIRQLARRPERGARST